MVFRDKNSDGTISNYVAEGTNRAIAAKIKKEPIEAEVIDDDEYKIGKVSIVTMIIARVFGIRNKKQ